jgi:hypothetical protein
MDLGDHESLIQANMDTCYDDGFEDGQNNHLIKKSSMQRLW